MKTVNARFTFLPYCIVFYPSGTMRVLNRDYTPMGGALQAHRGVDSLFRLKNGVPPVAILRNLHHRVGDATKYVRGETHTVTLYNDGCIPFEGDADATEQYMKRLDILNQLDIVSLRNNADMYTVYTKDGKRLLSFCSEREALLLDCNRSPVDPTHIDCRTPLGEECRIPYEDIVKIIPQCSY